MSSFDAEAAEQHFSFDQGDDEDFVITRQKSDGTTYDITGWTFWLTIKNDKSDSDADAVVQKAVTSHSDAANGETTIELANSDTSSLSGLYHYDIQEKTSSGTVNTLLKGLMTFDEDVTESTS